MLSSYKIRVKPIIRLPYTTEQTNSQTTTTLQATGGAHVCACVSLFRRIQRDENFHPCEGCIRRIYIACCCCISGIGVNIVGMALCNVLCN